MALNSNADPNAIEEKVHELTNRHRSDENIAALSYSPELSAITLQHSRDMALRDYCDHVSPEGDGALERYQKFGVDTTSVGKNIALRTVHPTSTVDSIAQSIVYGWLNSSGHRENLMRSRFETEGIGVYSRTDGTLYVTQNFQ